MCAPKLKSKRNANAFIGFHEIPGRYNFPQNPPLTRSNLIEMLLNKLHIVHPSYE